MAEQGLEAPPRRRDAQATRQAILAAGRRHFARTGYEATLLKEIAQTAGVDAALINRYFGGKEGLFASVLNEAMRSDRLIGGVRAQFGRDVAQALAMAAPQAEGGLEGFQLILRATMSPTTAPMLSAAARERFFAPVKDWMDGEDRDLRARLVAATLIGLLVEAMMRETPLSERERGPYVERVGAMLQKLVDG